jgi:hypothetical protein
MPLHRYPESVQAEGVRLGKDEVGREEGSAFRSEVGGNGKSRRMVGVVASANA